jgi:hypothetical protein
MEAYAPVIGKNILKRSKITNENFPLNISIFYVPTLNLKKNWYFMGQDEGINKYKRNSSLARQINQSAKH